MAEEKVYKTFKAILEEGSICKSYGSKYIFNCAPCPTLERVRFSLVELGTQGKKHLDFYLPFERISALPGMREFCDEIDSGTAEKRIAADMKNSYPQAYQFVSGKDGSKKLNIGAGQKGIRVQIQQNIDGKWESMMAVIGGMGVLKSISFWFKAVMGITPVNGYYAQLVKTYWDNINKYSGSVTQDASDAPYEGERETEPEGEKEKPAKQEKQEKKSAEEPKADQKKTENSKEITLMVKTASALSQTKSGDFGCWAILENGKKTAIKFSQATVNKMNDKEKFLESLSVEGKKLVGTFTPVENGYEFIRL